eukprot:g2030.t1
MKLDFVQRVGREAQSRSGGAVRVREIGHAKHAEGTEMVVTFALGYIAKAEGKGEDSNKAVKRKWIRANVYFRPPVQRGGVDVGGSTKATIGLEVPHARLGIAEAFFFDCDYRLMVSVMSSPVKYLEKATGYRPDSVADPLRKKQPASLSEKLANQLRLLEEEQERIQREAKVLREKHTLAQRRERERTQRWREWRPAGTNNEHSVPAVQTQVPCLAFPSLPKRHNPLPTEKLLLSANAPTPFDYNNAINDSLGGEVHYDGCIEDDVQRERIFGALRDARDRGGVRSMAISSASNGTGYAVIFRGLTSDADGASSGEKGRCRSPFEKGRREMKQLLAQRRGVSRGTTAKQGQNGVLVFYDLPARLAQHVRLLLRQERVKRPLHIVLGSHKQYFVRFDDGSASWAGSKTFNSLMVSLESMGLEERVRTVAFGEAPSSFIIVKADGSIVKEGLSAGIDALLDSRGCGLHAAGAHSRVVDVTLGENGAAFVRFADASWTSLRTPPTMNQKLNELYQCGHAVERIIFGNAGSWLVRYRILPRLTQPTNASSAVAAEAYLGPTGI